MEAPFAVTAIDMASVHSAGVSIRDGRVTEDSWEVPTKDFPGPAHAREMATCISEFVRESSYPLGAYHLVMVEDTYFGGINSGSSSTGEIRGIFYERMHSGVFTRLQVDCALLVSPARWRSFHGLSGAKGKEKQAAYAARALALGFVSEARNKRMREDATAAFLIASFGVAFYRHAQKWPPDPVHVPTGPLGNLNLDRLLNDQAARIYP